MKNTTGTFLTTPSMTNTKILRSNLKARIKLANRKLNKSPSAKRMDRPHKIIASERGAVLIDSIIANFVRK